jgi:hypothetical protein
VNQRGIAIKVKRFKTANTPDQLKTTLRLIGSAIKSGSIYPPIKHLASRTATIAPPKDYNRQIQAIYNAITKVWWRYVFDPPDVEWLCLDGPRIFSIILNKGKSTASRGKARTRGYEDCDGITTASGALLRSIGMDVRICTTAPPNSPNIFTHVFLQTKAPKSREWITFDPVLYPEKPLGSMTQHSRLAIWNLDGNLISKSGNFPPHFEAIMSMHGVNPTSIDNNLLGTIGDTTMVQPNFHDFEDYSMTSGMFGAADLVDDSPAAMPSVASTIADFQQHGIAGFGCYGDVMGSTPGNQVPMIMAEYDQDDDEAMGNTGYVRTKHFEMTPDDYQYSIQNGVPKVGALALGDDGSVYQWQTDPAVGFSGFFKKLFKRGRKALRRVKGALMKPMKKLFKRTKFGRTLWKIGSKIHRTAMKIVKTIIKKVGPIAARIAPIAALIPGIGPAIAGALVMTGKVAKIMKKLDIPMDRKGKPQPKNKRQARILARVLAAAGRKMGKSKANRTVKNYARKRWQRIGRKNGWLSGVDDQGVGIAEALSLGNEWRKCNTGLGWAA